MNYLWPYKSSLGKRKHWFRKGKKELLVTIRRRKGKTFPVLTGDPINNIIMDVGYTINLSEVIFEK